MRYIGRKRYLLGFALLALAATCLLLVRTAKTTVAANPFACRAEPPPAVPTSGTAPGSGDVYLRLLKPLNRVKHVVIRQTLCPGEVERVSYAAPNRLQFAEILNMGADIAGNHGWSITHNPTETQIGSWVGYTTHKWRQPRPRVAATADALLLPGTRVGPFYAMQVRHILHAMRFSTHRVGNHVVSLIAARGLPLDLCPPGAMCAVSAPNAEWNARYIGELTLDAHTGLPISYASWYSAAARARGKRVWEPYRPLQQVSFSYDRKPSIHFVSG